MCCWGYRLSIFLPSKDVVLCKHQRVFFLRTNFVGWQHHKHPPKMKTSKKDENANLGMNMKWLNPLKDIICMAPTWVEFLMTWVSIVT